MDRKTFLKAVAAGAAAAIVAPAAARAGVYSRQEIKAARAHLLAQWELARIATRDGVAVTAQDVIDILKPAFRLFREIR